MRAVVNEAALTSEELARLRAAFARVAYARLLGLELVEVARGTALLALMVRPDLTRMEGIMHGGALASLMDTASAFAVLSLLAPAEATITVDLTLHFLRPVSSGRVKARARVLRAGRSLVTVAIEATNEADELVATALTTYAVRR
ncbi:MAG: thioesterase [Acidobacteria bacterium]|nr:MAG: thioesterase [Acidobacteriota bacterium]